MIDVRRNALRVIYVRKVVVLGKSAVVLIQKREAERNTSCDGQLSFTFFFGLFSFFLLNFEFCARSFVTTNSPCVLIETHIKDGTL